jgi:spore coat protein CotH
MSMVGSYVATGAPAYVNAGFRFDDETLASTGFRLRVPTVAGNGDTERKYSLRVNFNYYGGPRFHGIDRIHFANNKNDPSLMREILFSRVLDRMQVPASRASYAWVKADGQGLGLYTMVEMIDERFVRAIWENQPEAGGGNLYKCEPKSEADTGCSLTWAGDRRTDYLDTTCLEEDGCGLVLKSNEDDPTLNNYSDLIDFLDFLNNSTDLEFAAGIEERFDVDAFLRYLAVAVALGDVTGYLGGIDNFYLYHRPDTGKFVFIPWDHNKSMGLTPCPTGAHTTGSSPDDPECTDAQRPLVERILAVGLYRSAYRGYLEDVLTLMPHQMFVWVNNDLNSLIYELVSLDPNYEYTDAQYQEAISTNEATTNFNLLQYVLERRAYLSAMLEDF